MDEILNLHVPQIKDWQYAHRNDITEVILQSDVAEIGVGAFHDCANLKKVILGPQVKLVKEGAFSSCPNLTDLYYSKTTQFENHCFNYSGGLINIVEDDTHTRAFYFPVDHQYAITIKNEELSTEEYTVYEGRVASPTFFPKGKIDLKQKLVYFVTIQKNGIEYSWFDTDLNQAIISTKYKASGLSYNEFFHTRLTLNSYISWEEFALLIGVCINGKILWRIAMQDINLDPEGKVSVKDILNWLKQFDGTLYARASLAVARAALPINYLDYNQMISGVWFKENLMHMLRSCGKIMRLNNKK